MKLPAHKAGLYLTHNDHISNSMEIEKWLSEYGDMYEVQSGEHYQRMIETNEVWTLQWYPNTPVGFLAVAAPTLEELLEFANE